MFKGLKVIEFSSVLAGPAVGMFFAELKADVIKIENKRTNGDVTRSWKLPSENAEKSISSYFSSVNWGKEHLMVDLSNSSALEKVLEIVKEADLVITNFKHGDDEKFGLDYKSLKALNSTLIYGCIKGFKSVPQRTAFDVVLQAETGYMSMNGTAESGPVKMPLAMIDLLAAHQLKEGLLIALLKKEKTGKGSCVETTLEEAAIASLANQASNWLMADHVAQRIGSQHPNIAPYGDTFSTLDGKEIVLAIGNDLQFKKMCQLLNADTISENELFSSNSSRVKNRGKLEKVLSPLFVKHKRDQLLQSFIKETIPAGAVRSIDEVFTNKVAQKMILTSEIDNHLTKRVKTVAFTISD